MANTNRNKGVMKEHVWWQDAILPTVAVLVAIWIIGGGIFNWAFFGDYSAKAATTSWYWKVLSIICLIGVAVSLVHANNAKKAGGNQMAGVLLAFFLLMAAALLMIAG